MIKDSRCGWGREDAYKNASGVDNHTPATSYTVESSGYIKAIDDATPKVAFEAAANDVYFAYNSLDAQGNKLEGWILAGTLHNTFTVHDFDKDEIIKLVDFYNAGDHNARSNPGASTDPHPNDPYNASTEATAAWVRPAGGLKLSYAEAFEVIRAKQIAIGGQVPQDYIHLPATGGSANSQDANTDQAIPWTSLFESVPQGVTIAGGVAQVAGAESKGKWADSNLTTKVKFPLANVLKRIEFQVGTQIWQTLEYNDLLSINATEIAESSYNRLGLQTSGYVRSDGQREARGEPVWAPGVKYQAFIPLPMLTKSIGPQLENFNQQSEDGYLMAAAPHQNVKIKVHYSAFNDIFNTANVHAKEVFTNSLGDFVTQPPVPWVPTATLTTKLYAQHMIMCNEEREQMKNMANGIPKRLKMTQNVNLQVPPKFYPDQAMTVDLDHFSIYGSHLIISATFPGKTTASMPTLKYAELKLNSASFSGQLDGSLLRGITNKTLGLYANQFNLDKEMLDSGIGYYVFPLASKAFGGSSIPLNRFDNIRLLLTFDHPDITSAGESYQGTINVTGVGETTGLYKAGAASLAMY
jgi:hypothetical protein